MADPTGRHVLDDADAATSAGVYRLLGRLWLREIDEPLLAELRHGPLGVAFAEVGGAMTPLIRDNALEGLAVEYCALFVGPVGHLPPYQSVWTVGQFHGDALESMRHYLALIDSGRIEDAAATPDHLGVQLRFMAAVLDDLARHATDPPTMASLTRLATRFFADHLTWPERLVDNLIARPSATFYADVGRITRDFLQLEHQRRLTHEPDPTSPSP